MEIRVYDNQMQLKGIIENHISLLWNRKYSQVGDFELHAPITDDNLKLLTVGSLVYKRNTVDCGIIENLEILEEANAKKIIAKGRFLPTYLDRRLITHTVNYIDKKVEYVMRDIITKVFPIDRLELGEMSGMTDEVSIQITFKNLLEMEEKLAQFAGYGFRIRPNFTEKKMYFEVYKGVDHSNAQNDRNKVIFSRQYNNLEMFDYIENDQLYKNVAYVAGEGEGSSRRVVVVGDETLVGNERRELYVDARDLQSEGLSTSEYNQMLVARGLEKLEEAVYIKSYESEVIPNANFKYLNDYDVGDIVTINNIHLRIAEVMEIYEHGEMNVNLTFGSPVPEKINLED